MGSRVECLAFLDREQEPVNQGFPAFPMLLGELRGVFDLYVRALADHYRITVSGPLAERLIASDRAEANR